MDKEKEVKEIAKYIGEDCEMRGLQPNSCFDVPDRTCDKCKFARLTAEKIYNAGYRKADVDENEEEE